MHYIPVDKRPPKRSRSETVQVRLWIRGGAAEIAALKRAARTWKVESQPIISQDSSSSSKGRRDDYSQNDDHHGE